MDYIIATGIFLVVFALVIQYVGTFFGNIATTTNARLMTTEATDLLSIADESSIPAEWPYFTPNNSVILYMHFDNSTRDSSVHGNHGTGSGGVNCSTVVPGRFDSACEFDALDDFMTLQYPAIPAGPFTITGWARVKNLETWRFIMWQQETQLYFGTNYIAARLWNGATPYIVSSASNKNINTWYHFAFVFNSTHIMLYINGVNESTPVSTTGNALGTGTTYIGRDETLNGVFNGTIDELIVFNRSLGAEEVRNLYVYETGLSRIGLMSKAYRFDIVVNNSRAAWKDQSKAWVNITNELVIFNYTDMGLPARVSSTTIYDDSGNNVPYNINGNIITFVTPVTVNSTRNFTIYFDDDANFPERTGTVTGFDNLTERVFPAQKVDIIQYRKIVFLNNSNYALVKNATDTPRDFRLTLIDSGNTVFTFGPDVPDVKNVFATRRFVVYQNSTGGVRRGALSIQVW